MIDKNTAESDLQAHLPLLCSCYDHAFQKWEELGRQDPGLRPIYQRTLARTASTTSRQAKPVVFSTTSREHSRGK